MERRHRPSRDGAWRRYLPARGRHLIHIPAKVCGFCRTRTHVPSREGWQWKPAELAGRPTPFTLSSCPSCYRLHADGEDRRQRAGSLAAEAEVVMPRGLSMRPGRCPKCESLLDQEPGYARCRWGCGKLWPIRGASLVRQTEYELGSGLRLSA